MVGVNAAPEPAPVTNDGVLILTEYLPVDAERDRPLLEPLDYHAAQETYVRSAARAEAAQLDPHPIALDAAVDAVTPLIAEEALERLHGRLLALADHINTGRVDAFEMGLRVAAVQARALGRELAGGAR